MARPSIIAGLPKFQRGGFWLFVVAAAASALIADQPLAADLTLNHRFLTDLALWQPLSATFVFPEGQLGGLIGTFAIQWFIGSHLEATWGVRRYLTLVLGAAVIGYLALALLGLAAPGALMFPSGGTGPADLAAVIGFGVILGRQPVQLFGALPLSARGLAALLAALMLLSPLLRGHWPQAIPAAVAALAALLLASRWRSPPTSGKVAARGARPRHLKVVDAGRRDKLLN